jgi:hypothetical protein
MLRPLLFILTLLTPANLLIADDENSFSVAPDASWARVEPLKEIGQDLANFDFSNQTCRITCGVPSAAVIQAYGVAAAPRASLLAPTSYLNAVASVDLVVWQPPQGNLLDGSFPAVYTRIQPNTGFGKTSGFSLALQTLQGGTGRIRIYLAANEGLTQLAESPIITLDPTRTYRLVLISRGNQHIGSIYNLTNPGTPLTTISAQNNTYQNSPGRCGIGVATPHPLPIDVTFDNFLAWDGTPAPLTIHPGPEPETIEIRSDVLRSMASRLETTTDLADPLSWQAAFPLTTTTNGPILIRRFPIFDPSAFFRNKAL